MKCFAKDTGPNRGPCENEATEYNYIKQPMCASCCKFANETIRLLNVLNDRIGHPDRKIHLNEEGFVSSHNYRG